MSSGNERFALIICFRVPWFIGEVKRETKQETGTCYMDVLKKNGKLS